MNTILLDRTDLIEVVTKLGDRFAISPDLHTCVTVFWRYRFEDIRPDDQVIDLGANIGGFSIAASHFTHKEILAVEPVRYRYLIGNIEYNHANIRAVRGGIGDGRTIAIEWNGACEEVPTASLREYIDMVGGCDFLKMDIEGAEWMINPVDLDGIRRIEGQFHFDLSPYPREPWKIPLVRYLHQHFNISYTPNSPPGRVAVPPTPSRPDPNRPQFHAERVS